MLAAGRWLLGAWRRLRFHIWTTELRMRLRAAGARLELSASRDVVLEGRPLVRVYPLGQGAGVLRLRLGQRVHLESGVRLEVWGGERNTLAIGDDSLIQSDARFILRGGAIELGRRCNIKDGTYVKSDGSFRAGDEVQIGQFAALHCAERVELEDWVVLAERTTILDSEHGFGCPDRHFRENELQVEPTLIGHNSFVGAGGVILKGSVLGANCVVGANAVVRAGTYGDGVVLAGNPAEVVKTLAPPE